MRQPTSGVVCGVCGGPVYDDGSELDKREACPRCGSLSRRFYRSIEETLTPGKDMTGDDDALGALRNDIARLTDQLERLQAALDVASSDPLTGLRNKPAVERAIAEHMGGDPDEPLTVLFIDMEKFKECNDTFGHDAGDEVLKEFTRRVTAVLGPGELFRCGGDEFIAMLESTIEAGACDLANRVCTAVRQPAIDVGGGRTAQITTSIGIACRPPHGGTATDLIRLADLAMYESKRAGGDKYTVAAAKPTVHRAVQKSAVQRQKPPRLRS